MLRYRIIILCFVFSGFGTILRAGEKEHREPGKAAFLYEFLAGSYEVVGKMPDSNTTYSGTVLVKHQGNGLEIIRRINGESWTGRGMIESATADKIKVLRVQFSSGKKHYEATYLIASDLDNYARLTGYVYLPKGGTKIPGLEAWFAKRESPGN